MTTKKLDIAKLNKWKSEISSRDIKVALPALKQIEEIGDMQVFPLLLNALKNDPDIQVEKAILKLIADIQSEEKLSQLFKSIHDENNTSLRLKLLTCVWNSKQDSSEYLADVVSLSTEGDFMQALECLTIIENMLGPFTENQLLEAQLYLKEYLEGSDKELDNRKAQLISEIATIVKEQNEGIDADLLLE